MNCKLCRFFILISLLLFIAAGINAQENQNITCINQFYHNWTHAVSDVAVQGDYAYLACRNDGLRIINTTNLSSPIEVGHLSSLYAVSAAAAGSYVYVGGASQDGIIVVDVSNPSNPTIAAAIPTAGWVAALKIKGNRLYSGTNYDGLTVTDISDPLSPVPLGQLTVIDDFGFDVQGDIVYSADGLNGMTVWDFSDLANPVAVGNYAMSDYHSANDVAVKEGYAYIASDIGLEVVDLATMQLVSSIDSFDCSAMIDVQGNLVYISYGCIECPLAIVDITNPLSPQTMGIYYPPEENILNFKVYGDLVYIADGYRGMRVVDVSNPAVPEEIAGYNRYGSIEDIRIVGSIAYVRESYNLSILDVSDPLNPLELSRFEPFTYGFSNFELSGNTAFLVGYDFECLKAIDVSDPAHPELIGTFSMDDYPYAIAVFNHYAVLGGGAGAHIIDLSDPANMTEVGFYPCLGGCLGVEADDQYVYVVDFDNSFYNEIIVALDMADPTNPAPAITWDASECWNNLATANGLVFASTSDGILIFDTNNLQSTSPIATLNYFEQYQSSSTAIHVADNRLYLSLWNYGIIVYDIQDAANPQFAGCFDTPGNALNSATNGDILYLADGSNFGIYDCLQAVNDVPHNPAARISEFALLSNYPNPFNSTTQIRFEVAGQNHVSLAVFDMLGRQVTTLADQNFTTGTHVIPWNGTNASGDAVASGRYFVRAKTSDGISAIPIVLLK
ncbi:T9SS type A sorting domain-containing protein [bacterium]|nr:T9SS type A sorting domain-containing protein [bacterium]